MKAYELKALLATLDDSAEVSIELDGIDSAFTRSFDCEPAGPRRARLIIAAHECETMKVCNRQQIEEAECRADSWRDELDTMRHRLGAIIDGCDATMAKKLEALL